MEQKLFTKNFILLVLGQVSSLFGNYILRLALSMYVLETTGSAAVFAGILSAAVIPTILLSPLGGILADRANRRNIMVALDALTGVSVLCAAVILSEDHALMVIGALLVALSVFGAFETPTVQACIPQMLAGDNIIRGNAVVNQVASISYLTAPMLGGILYAAFGLKPVMYASVVCFFITALSECFIQLGHQHRTYQGNVLSMVKDDFSASIRFITKERADLMKLLLLAALSRFFVMGVTMVGIPFIVRTILGLDATYYGGAESALAIATILGSIAAGLLTGKLKMERLSFVLAAIGICIIPAGIIFLFPFGAVIKYAVSVATFCGMQAAISIFSIFAVSMIQQSTPDHLLGKVMAYTSAITMCAQPVGQMIYGFLFDGCREAVYLVLIPTGVIVGMIGVGAMRVFNRLTIKSQYLK
ncbi:MAG: MFS transporter [Lachnospiraceae bacterium]|nr:MFS transporter [Lachnospiraceae bacterium]